MSHGSYVGTIWHILQLKLKPYSVHDAAPHWTLTKGTSVTAVQLRLPVLPPRLAQLNSQPWADLSGQMAHQRAKTLQRTSAAKKCIVTILHCDLFKPNPCIILTSFWNILTVHGKCRTETWNGSPKGLICIGLRSAMCCRFWWSQGFFTWTATWPQH